MDSGPTLKPKVTVKLNYNKSLTARPPTQSHIPSRPSSPVKSYISSNVVDTTFRPKAKVNSSATSRKAGPSSTVSGSTSSTPRAGSPVKLTPRVKKGVVSPTYGVNRTLKSPPTASAPVTPELRKIAASSSLRAEDSRSRSGSVVSLHHAASFSSFHPSSSSVVSSGSASPRLMPSKSIVGLTERGQTSSPTLKIRSKVTNLAKAAADSALSPPQTQTNPTGSTSPPMLASTRLPNARTRAPSTSSAVGQQQYQQHQSGSPKLSPASPPPPQFYPITTAVPAANPHRFASSRPTPATVGARSPPSEYHHIFQSFSQPSSAVPFSDQSNSPSSASRPRSAGGLLMLNGTATAKVDPASIPLPPHSPPASAVSFSSRSSMSRSSASASYLGMGLDSTSSTDSGSGSLGPSGASSNLKQQVSPDNLRATLDNLMQYTSGMDEDHDDPGHDRDRETDGELEGAEEHKVKAAAKSNRKIADLEITNRSLLVINASLEATKHRQAKEITELRRKLRESRLILPPRAFLAVKSSLGPAELDDDEEEVEEEDDEEDLEGAGGGGDGARRGGGDEIYKRIKVILDTLLKTGKAALETDVKDFPEGGRGGAKVLSPEELKNWHEQDTAEENDNSFSMLLEPEVDTQELEHSELEQLGHTDHDIPLTEDEHNEGEDGFHSFDTAADEDEDGVGDETTMSEDEVEAMTIPAFSPPSSPPPPPILVTQPT